MRCYWRRWLWGLIPVVLLSVVAVGFEHGRLENDLGQRASQALAQAGFAWAAADFRGRDGVLTGLAAQEGEPQKAAEVLASLWGVRRIDNRAGLIEKAERYQWWASRRNTRVRLSGYVPDNSARQAIVGVARATFPGLELADRMTLARGVPVLDDWLGGISFALKQLAALRRGDVSLDGLALAVTGEAEDVAGYRAIYAGLRGALPKGVSLLKADVTPPVVTPYSWVLKSLDGELLFKGYVPSEADRAALLAAAKQSAPGAPLRDEMEPAGGAPQGWGTAAIACVRELAALEGGSAELNDTVLFVAGTASDAGTAAAIRSRLRAVLPAGIDLRDQISARQPPPENPPAPPPDLLPPAASAPPSPAGDRPPTPASPSDGVARQPLDTGGAPPEAAATASLAAPSPTNTPSDQPQGPPRVLTTGDPRAQGCKDALADAAGSGVILFRVGSAELEAASFATLDRLAKAAQSCPGMVIEVAGHASAEGGDAVNQRLSTRRAQSVVNYLVRAGVDRQQLEGIGFGASRPILPNDSSEHMAKNRRIDFTVRPR